MWKKAGIKQRFGAGGGVTLEEQCFHESFHEGVPCIPRRAGWLGGHYGSIERSPIFVSAGFSEILRHHVLS